MRSPLDLFAGVLDRSVQEIAALTADSRRLDTARVGRIADIWDNNTFPLVSVAGAMRPLRSKRARAGLHRMADFGSERRALLVDLDPSLDDLLPAAVLEPSVHRDYWGQVRPGFFPVTDDFLACLGADYDLANASVRSLTMRRADTGVEVQLTLAASRRFTPATGRVAPDGSIRPWPDAPLRFSFSGVSTVLFDADDRIGLVIASGDVGPSATIGRGGRIQAATATVCPDDPRWHESTAGQTADRTTPFERRGRSKPVMTASLTSQQQAAARAFAMLMIQVRLVGYYPRMAARIPVREICRVAASAGTAILSASGHHGSARRKAFAELEERWRHVPPYLEASSIPTGPVMLRYASYEEPHEDYDVSREGSAVLLAAVPDVDPSAPWNLASEEVSRPTQFRIATAAFEGEQQFRAARGTLTIGDSLAVQAASTRS